MQLYFALRTRAVRVRWLLEELGVAYELVKLDLAAGENRSPAYLALNPLGELPAFVDGELTLTESAAIYFYLADRFPEAGLAGSPGSRERALCQQWVAFAEERLEAAVKQGEAGREQAARLLGVLEAALAGREHVVDARFSVADLVLASVLHMAHFYKLLEGHPALVEYCHRHAGRPASRKAVTA